MIPTAKGLILWPIDTKSTAENIPATKRAPVTIAGAIDEVVELGWLHAKMHHAHKDEEEKELKDWIRNNAEAASD
jgi:hypothetical protein